MANLNETQNQEAKTNTVLTAESLEETVVIKEKVEVKEQPTQQQTAQQQPQQEQKVKPVETGRHEQLDPVSDTEPYTTDEFKEVTTTVIPSTKYKTVEKALDDIYAAETKTTSSGATFDLNPQQQEAIAVMIKGGRGSNKEDVLYDNLNKNTADYVNDIKFGDTSYNTSTVTFKKTGDKVAGANAIAIFRSFMSIGDVIHIPLWHSGFWVVLKPPTQTEIVNLQLAITNNEITLGRDTTGLIYSNYSVVFNRIIMDFIVDHINTQSIKLDDNDDIRDYISLNDFYPLVTGLLATMNPEGIEISRGCANTAEIDEDGKPKCSFTVKGKVDPRKLTWVNRTKLSGDALAHMSKRLPNSMTKQEVKEYQLRLEDIKTKDYEITTSIGAKFKVTFEIPTIKENIQRGEEWVNEIISVAQRLFKENDSETVKNQRVDEIAFASVLCIYNTFVKSFTYADGRVNDDKATFNTILSDISLDKQTFESFIANIKDFITQSPICIVATPNFVCPECGLKQKDTKDEFKEFIPLNIVEHFFDHCASRINKVRELKL